MGTTKTKTTTPDQGDSEKDVAPTPVPDASTAEVSPTMRAPIPVERFVVSMKGDKTLLAAFLHVERLNNRKARKMSKDEWAAEYSTWCSQPRG